MKIFISHQQRDTSIAEIVQIRLERQHDIRTYLDVIDPDTSRTGDQLGEYIRSRLGECTQLIAVVSTNTKESWWVPWEIGVATEKDYPIATFAGGTYCILPTYLKKWPYLQSERDLDIYAREAKKTEQKLQKFADKRKGRSQTTPEFHNSLRAALGQ